MMAFHRMVLVWFLVSLVSFTMAQNSVTVHLNNSQILSATAQSGDLHHYYFSASELTGTLASFHSLLDGLNKRAIPGVYLTITTCSQPTPPPNYKGDIPSLEAFLSLSSDNTLPGPTRGSVINDTLPGRIAWDGGPDTLDVWIGVVAPTLTEDWRGQWTYQIGISTAAWMHPLLGNQSLTLDDTDQHNALFLSQPYIQTPANATVMVTHQIPATLRWSFCAAQSYRVPNYTVNVTETTRGLSEGLRQQILVSNLTEGLDYTAYYINTVGGTVGISRPIPIRTKTDASCRLIFNLEFCTEVAYSVPVSPGNTNDSASIARIYDANAAERYKPFQNAISQFNCDTTKYSLVRNCTDCQVDYKRWLCAVSIPRCTGPPDDTRLDVPDADMPVLGDTPLKNVQQVAANESRIEWMGEGMAPGTWTELLPCIDLCYRVVQSCPPFMQFNCPQNDLATLQYGYWKTGQVVLNDAYTAYGIDNPTCNRVGLDPSLLIISASGKLRVPIVLLCLSMVLAWIPL